MRGNGVTVYVESNFVLEIALQQEEYRECRAIVRFCQTGRARLVIPAFSIVEPFTTVVRRHKDRRKLQDDLARELRQLGRTKSYQSKTAAMSEVTALLLKSLDHERRRLDQAVRLVLDVAEVVPLTAELLREARAAGLKYGLTFTDAVVLTSIRSDLDVRKGAASCFLNKNVKDFDDPDIHSILNALGCKLLPRFASGIRYLKSKTREDQ
jgi:predicted nucleic acid-binding protein